MGSVTSSWDEILAKMMATASMVSLASPRDDSVSPMSPDEESRGNPFASNNPFSSRLSVVASEGLQPVSSLADRDPRPGARYSIPRRMVGATRIPSILVPGNRRTSNPVFPSYNPFSKPPDSEGLEPVFSTENMGPLSIPRKEISLQSPSNPEIDTSPRSPRHPFSPQSFDLEHMGGGLIPVSPDSLPDQIPNVRDWRGTEGRSSWVSMDNPPPPIPLRERLPGNESYHQDPRMGQRRSYSIPGQFPETLTENDYEHRRGNEGQHEILIAVFGMTGTGKTTFIEKVSGKKLKVGHNLRSCTMNIEKIHCKVGGQNITLIDTPGFDDTDRSDTDVLILIANWLQESYDHRAFLSGIIYLHRISDIRMSGSSLKNLRMFRKLCGTESMANVLLVTNMWDKVSPEEGETRESDLRENAGFWRSMIASGCLMKRHDGSVECAKNLVLDLAGNHPTMLKLQQEIAEGKPLIETEAGVILNRELLEVQRRHQEELQVVKEEMERAMKNGNETLQKELESQHAQVVQDIQTHAEAHQRLLDAKARDLQAQIASERAKNSEAQNSLRDQVAALKRELAEGNKRAASFENGIGSQTTWICQPKGFKKGCKCQECKAKFCGKTFYAPRHKSPVWCSFCGQKWYP